MAFTKQGEHGTLYKFAVKYTDKYDGGFGEATVHYWAYDEEHALDRFYDNDEGFKHLSVQKVKA